MSVFGSGRFAEPAVADVSLNLTALMDILSNLLFFLLASYTTQSIEIEPKPGLKLPVSSSEQKPSKELTISVTDKAIFVGDVEVSKVNDSAVPAASLAGEKIVPLFERLKSVQQGKAAAGTDDEAHGGDLLMVLCDRDTDSQLVGKVLKTAAMAGFVKARFGVLSQ